jgi:hypothetical protein
MKVRELGELSRPQRPNGKTMTQEMQEEMKGKGKGK